MWWRHVSILLSKTPTLCLMWSGGALIQVSALWCYFEVSLEWDVDVCVMYILASSSERERDVWRISEKYRSLADLSGCCDWWARLMWVLDCSRKSRKLQRRCIQLHLWCWATPHTLYAWSRWVCKTELEGLGDWSFKSKTEGGDTTISIQNKDVFVSLPIPTGSGKAFVIQSVLSLLSVFW